MCLTALTQELNTHSEGFSHSYMFNRLITLTQPLDPAFTCIGLAQLVAGHQPQIDCHLQMLRMFLSNFQFRALTAYCVIITL